MENQPLLKPMPPDALIRRPHQQASAQVQPVRFVNLEKDPVHLRTPVFAHRPAKEPDPADDLDALLAPFMAEDDDDDPLEDAVPTSLMPMPVCVPLYETAPEKKRRAWWLILLIALIGAAAYMLWTGRQVLAGILTKF